MIGTGLLCLFLAGAAWTDTLYRKVYNRWIAAGAIAGILCRGQRFFPAALAVLAVSFVLFRMRVMGAGDGKLMAVTAGYLGMDAGMEVIFIGMVMGALWSLWRLWHGKGLKAYLISLISYFMGIFQTKTAEIYGKEALENPERTIPLAPCMAAGAYLYLMVSGAKAVWMG